MDNLPKIIDHEGKKVVSAREMYLALGFDERNWVRWYEKNITKNQFAIENQDYSPFVLKRNGENQILNPNPTKDFALTIEFAKRLAMMARTEAGEKVRNYFIECEKKLTEPNQLDFTNPATVLKLAQNWADEYNKRLEAEKVIEDQRPKVEYVDKVLRVPNTHTTTVIAKELGMSAYRLHQVLCEMKVIYPHQGSWVLYSKYDDKGYTKTRTHTFDNGFGVLQSSVQTV